MLYRGESVMDMPEVEGWEKLKRELLETSYKTDDKPENYPDILLNKKTDELEELVSDPAGSSNAAVKEAIEKKDLTLVKAAYKKEYKEGLEYIKQAKVSCINDAVNVAAIAYFLKVPSYMKAGKDLINSSYELAKNISECLGSKAEISTDSMIVLFKSHEDSENKIGDAYIKDAREKGKQLREKIKGLCK